MNFVAKLKRPLPVLSSVEVALAHLGAGRSVSLNCHTVGGVTAQKCASLFSLMGRAADVVRPFFCGRAA